jgi:hypothetical protein
MPADLTAYKVLAERSNWAKFDGLVTTAEAALRAVGDPSKNAWGAGKILDPNQLKQGGAADKQTLVWNGTLWLPTTVPTRTLFTTTSTVDIVNDATEKDLFTGNAAGATGGFNLVAGSVKSGSSLRFVCGGDYLSNTGANHDFTLSLSFWNGSILKRAWQASTGSKPPRSATRRCWHLTGRVGFAHDVTSFVRTEVSGKYILSDLTPAAVGLGTLRTPTSHEIFASIGTAPDDTEPALNTLVDNRFEFTVQHDAAAPLLSMRCFYARVELFS